MPLHNGEFDFKTCMTQLFVVMMYDILWLHIMKFMVLFKAFCIKLETRDILMLTVLVKSDVIKVI